MNSKKVRVIDNPVIMLNLCTMRDKNTDSQGVRIATRKITRCLLYEAAQNLPLVETEITTPLTTFKTKTVDPDIDQCRRIRKVRHLCRYDFGGDGRDDRRELPGGCPYNGGGDPLHAPGKPDFANLFFLFLSAVAGTECVCGYQGLYSPLYQSPALGGGEPGDRRDGGVPRMDQNGIYGGGQGYEKRQNRTSFSLCSPAGNRSQKGAEKQSADGGDHLRPALPCPADRQQISAKLSDHGLLGRPQADMKNRRGDNFDSAQDMIY